MAKKWISCILICLSFYLVSFGNSLSNESDNKIQLHDEFEKSLTYESQWGSNSINGELSFNFAGFQEGSIYSNTTLAMGSNHACSIHDDNSVWCWGANWDGQIGDGTSSPFNLGSYEADRLTPVNPTLSGTISSISAGGSSTCAISSEGDVFCWGNNDYGQLADGTSGENRLTPIQAQFSQNALQISVSDYHTCAILVDGSVECSGRNNAGQLGDGYGDSVDNYPLDPEQWEEDSLPGFGIISSLLAITMALVVISRREN